MALDLKEMAAVKAADEKPAPVVNAVKPVVQPKVAANDGPPPGVVRFVSVLNGAFMDVPEERAESYKQSTDWQILA